MLQKSRFPRVLFGLIRNLSRLHYATTSHYPGFLDGLLDKRLDRKGLSVRQPQTGSNQ
jgi:hypothetical protein